MEHLPFTMAYCLVAGLVYPRAAAISGLGWVACRLLFAYGYVRLDVIGSTTETHVLIVARYITSPKPDGRGRYLGSGYYLFQIALWGMALTVGGKLIRGTL